MAAAAQFAEKGMDLYAENLKFFEEEVKIHSELRPALATANRVMLDLRTMLFPTTRHRMPRARLRSSLRPMQDTRR